jgi:hypothetical protein
VSLAVVISLKNAWKLVLKPVFCVLSLLDILIGLRMREAESVGVNKTEDLVSLQENVSLNLIDSQVHKRVYMTAALRVAGSNEKGTQCLGV